MKHLRVKVYISIVFLYLLGAFLTFGTVSAQGIDSQTATGNIVNNQTSTKQVTESDYISLQGFAKEIDFDYKTIASRGFISPVNTPSPKYLELLKNAYDSTKNDPKTTKRSLEVQALNSFIVYLNETIPTTQNTHKSALEAVLIVTQQKFQFAISAVQLENKTITPEQHQENLKNANTQSQAAIAKRSEVGGCSLIGNSPIIGCLNEALSWLVKNSLLQIAGWLLWLAANMFNYAVQIGILNFKDWAPDALYPVWTIVRQIISLAIVFIGLYLGFMYILGREDKFEKYIPWVIVFALFVNFSYPLARLAIDITNIVSLNIYTSTVGVNSLTAGISSPDTGGALIMNKLGLNGLIYGVVADTADGGGNASLGDLSTLPPALLAVAFVLYAAYIFFRVATIIIMRTILLVALTVASPILFVDSVLPFLGDKAKMLRKVFFEQLMVGPIFMIMFALTLKFLDVFSFATKGGPAVTGRDVSVVTFFNIIMMLVMLHIMAKVTKEFAGTLGNVAADMVGKAGGLGLGVAGGAVGLAGRKFIGGSAEWLGKSSWIQNNQHTALGRAAKGISGTLANANFDIRNSSVIAGAMGKAGMGLGTGRKLGYTAAKEARIKEAVERGNQVGTYQENVFNDDGSIKHKKGDRIDSAAADEARRKYAQNGGTIFNSKDSKNEINYQVFQTKSDKALTEYKERMEEANEKFDDTDEGRAAKKVAQDKKSDYFNKQDSETQAKLMKYEAKVEKEKTEKEGKEKTANVEKEEKKQMAAAALEAQKAIAEASKSSAEASRAVADELKKMRNPSGSQSTTPQPAMAVIPASMTTTASGIIVPTNAVVPPRVSVDTNSSPTPQTNTTTQKSPMPNINTENVADRWARPADTGAGQAPSSPLPQRPLPSRPQPSVQPVSPSKNSASSSNLIIT